MPESPSGNGAPAPGIDATLPSTGAPPAPSAMADIYATIPSDAGGATMASATMASATIQSTVVGAPAAAPVPGSIGTEFTLQDAKEQWGDGDLAGATATGSVSVQVADPENRRTVSINVMLRRGTMASDKRPSVGEDFRIVEVLGVGGMGAVFRARQTSLNRPVAIKVIRPEHAKNEQTRAKFITEAVLTGTLDHPNIIPLHDLGVTEDGGVFYAMKEVKGRSWASRIGELTEDENLDILLRVADAVAFAHDRGIIHRDLKPENVMLGDYGEVLLMDWGIAAPYRPTEEGEPVPMGRAGTPAYMAPEMARGEHAQIGPASDVYLLGAILYEIVTGQRVHTGETVYACLAAAANNRIVPTDIESELLDVARKALASKPENRYPNVKAFQAAIRDYQRHQESLILAGRAAEHLCEAREKGGYERYNRAIFGYSEALSLWEDNHAARAGERDARLALAEQALALGDYDLALGALETLAGEERADRLGERARAAKRENEQRRKRIRRLRLAAVGLLLAALVILGGATYLVSRQYAEAERARGKEAEARVEAEKQRAEAVTQRSEAETQRAAAEKSQREAERQAEIAARNEQAAKENAEVAQEQTRRAERALEDVKEANRLREQAAAAQLAALEERNAALEQQRREVELRREAERLTEETEFQLSRAGYLEDRGRWTLAPEAARDKQAGAARAAGAPDAVNVPLPDGLSLALALVPAGEFTMGSSTREAGRSAEEALHPVRITRPFYLGRYELTRAQWRALVPKEDPEALRAGNVASLLPDAEADDAWLWRSRELTPEERDWPASGLSPRDVEELLLPALAPYAPKGYAFRLPTEAEWEYACRAGSAARFHTGDAAADALRAGWIADNSGDQFHPVGRLEPNAWGFYDMHGNVYELVADRYARAFYFNSPEEDPMNAQGDNDQPLYVTRGGSVLNEPARARAAHRTNVHRENRFPIVGVRLALSPMAE